MIVYNVTVKLESSIAEQWLQWMKEEHIPDVIATSCFTSASMLRLLETDDSDGPTYAIQYQAESKADYNRYIEKFAASMRTKATEKWGHRFVAFRSVLQLVQ